jgi:hypothetical protein
MSLVHGQNTEGALPFCGLGKRVGWGVRRQLASGDFVVLGCIVRILSSAS